MTHHTLPEIKVDLIALAATLDCDCVVIKDCYINLGTTYSIRYDRTNGKTYKIEAGQAPIEIVI